MSGPVEAITLDFYRTLVHHRSGRGRGRELIAYLEGCGFACPPWEHRVLYDVFEAHAREYDPAAPPDRRDLYYRRLAGRVFERLGIVAPGAEVDRRAPELWEILGPSSLAVYEDVPHALVELRARGFPLAVVSNWQCGLGHFCAELGIAEHFEHVVVSAEVGSEKPDPGIFLEACRRLGADPAHVLHVGDTLVDDVEGSRAAGLQNVLLARGGVEPPPGQRSIASLAELPRLARLSGRRPLRRR